MNAKILICALVFCLPSMVWAQGFAGLGTDATGFTLPKRGYDFEFPRDHAAHESFRIEWWYVPANLTSSKGEHFGVQWTLFRSALAPDTQTGWTDPQIWLGHAAVTSKQDHVSAERYARGGIGQAGVDATDGFTAWIDEWQFSGDAALQDMKMTATGSDFSYNLDLTTQAPLVFQGDNEFSVKSAEGQASYYYSQPFFSVTVSIEFKDETHGVKGTAWLDREWSSQPLGSDQSGWDWFSLSFDTGEKMMGFALRSDQEKDYLSGTWINAGGTYHSMTRNDLSIRLLNSENIDGIKTPTRWQIDVPAKNLSVTTMPLNPNSWMKNSISYWEGPIFIDGTHSGQGYLEMTGYE